MPRSEIDVNLPFTFYGYASLEGVNLAAELEKWLGIPVPLSLIWDHPTIDEVSEYLAEECKSASAVEVS